MNVIQYYRPPGKTRNKAFISTWRTTSTSTGSSASNQIKLPLVATGTYDFIIKWGDGSSSHITSWNQTETTHTYASSGDYTLTITGTVSGWSFLNNGDRLKILGISQWGSIEFQSNTTNTQGSFYSCQNLNITATDVPKILGSTAGFFGGCTSLVYNSSIDNWDVSLATDMNNMFMNCSSFNQPIGSWDVSNVTMFATMFSGATVFNQNLSNWDTSSAINMGSMFKSTLFNNNGSPGIDNWDVSNVVNFGLGNARGMFQLATNFNQPIGSWDVSSATDFNYMFSGATSFNQPLGSWNVGNVTTMVQMFSGATSFNQPLGSWNVGNVTTMVQMFSGATSFNQPLGSWNVGNVTTMAQMFVNNFALTQTVEDMTNMWITTKLTTSALMFSGCNSLTGNGNYFISKPKAAGYTVGTATNTGSYRTFYLCSSLTDYATISANYK